MAGTALRLSIDHPTQGLRSFPLPSDDEPTVDVGGFTNEPQYTSEGAQIIVQNVKGWKIESITAIVDAKSGDIEYLQEVINSGIPATITYETIDGITYTGSGTIEGDLKSSLKTQKAPLTISGGGKLKQI